MSEKLLTPPNRYLQLTENRLLILWGILFVLFMVFFLLYPRFDLSVSAIFFQEGFGFPLRHQWMMRLLYDSVNYLTIVSSFWIIGSVGWYFSSPFFFPHVQYFRTEKFIRQVAIVALTLVVSAGILTNFLKLAWGRERPVAVREFGGERDYTPPFHLSPQTGKSFVSGHASTAFVVVSMVLAFLRKRRWFFYSLALVYGGTVSIARVMQGGHYLSDVIFGGLLTLLLAHFFYYLLSKSEET